MNLDEHVRVSLRRQVQDPPPMDAPADQAIAGASRVRRQQVVTAACAGVTALLLSTGAIATLRHTPNANRPLPPATQPAGTPTVVPSAIVVEGLDLLVDRSSGAGWQTLVVAGGRALSLAGIDAEVRTAYRISGGWLVGAFKPEAGDSLWLVTPDGSAYRLVGDAEDEPAVAPGGRAFAWRGGNRIRVGHLSGTALVEDTSVPAPPRGVPIAYTGTAVVLGYSETGGGTDQFDVWLPAAGTYTPAWNRSTHVAAIYPPAPDGSLLGLVNPAGGGKGGCLARLDPTAHLKATRTACGLSLTVDSAGLVSPDGRWLAVPTLADDRNRVALLDLRTVFTNPVVTASWDASAVGWLDATTLEVVAYGTPMVARIGQPNLTPLTMTGLPGGSGVEPVRRLG